MAFMPKNVMKDLWLRGYKETDLPQGIQGRVVILGDCLRTGITVTKYRNALKVNEDALAKQLLNPSSLPTCVLHGKM